MVDAIERHVDVDAIEMLKEIMEDDFVLLINTFLNDGIERISQIQDAAQSQVADEIRRAAHSFKGSSANIGAHKLQGFCLELENAGASNALDNIPQVISEINSEFETVTQILKTHYL
ncbi:Hpt domain-containing protein [Marinicellulosiphila megalodicopiae]|uniref:Hpt domain-containing protein n=1 Tax=Marinicellulosiphila megalodicopiae TaxID=2724896 RepID=UPI003BAFD305